METVELSIYEAEPTVAQLGFSSSDIQCVEGHFPCFIAVFN